MIQGRAAFAPVARARNDVALGAHRRRDAEAIAKLLVATRKANTAGIGCGGFGIFTSRLFASSVSNLSKKIPDIPAAIAVRLKSRDQAAFA